MKFLMEKVQMKNCIIVITRHYTQKMFAGRWTAIQNQFAIIASKLGYNIPHNLDIHAFLRSTNSSPYEYKQAAPPKEYSRITPLMSMDTQYRTAHTPNERYNLQRSFDMFTHNSAQDCLPQPGEFYQNEFPSQSSSQYGPQMPSTASHNVQYPPPPYPPTYVKTNSSGTNQPNNHMYSCPPPNTQSYGTYTYIPTQSQGQHSQPHFQWSQRYY